MSTSCAAIGRHLDAYFDGELEPRTRALVSGHLILCDSCRERMDHIREIGELLRARAAAPAVTLNLSGLASGVISRARAEESQSWRAWLHRGVEDWHWAMIGAGSLSAAIISVVIAAAVVALGHKPEREDSLAALLNNLQAPAGKLWMIATPVGPDQAPMLMEFDSGASGGPDAVPGEMPEGFSAPSEADLAVLLSNAVIGPDGRMTNLATMSKQNREQTEPLLLEIVRQRNALPAASWSGRQVNVQRLWLTTNTSVSAKPLEP
jgi:hypothetical protein